MGKKGKQKKPPSSQKSKSGPKGKPGALEEPSPAKDLDMDMEDLTLDSDEDEDADEAPQNSSVHDKAMKVDKLAKQKGNGKTRKPGVELAEEVKNVDDGSDEEKPEGASSSTSSVDVKEEKKMTRKELKKLKKKVK